MNPDKKLETHVSIVAAENGAALIFQGFFKQALFLKPENISRFIHDPLATGMLVIPPMASLALQCYVAAEAVTAILLAQDLALGEHYALTVRLKSGAGIRYYSEDENLAAPSRLAAEHIRVVVTPKRVALVESHSAKPYFAAVVDIPTADVPDYRGRFAHDAVGLAAALERTLAAKQHTLCYEH